jgi:N-acetylneuraminic acid mutarotase
MGTEASEEYGFLWGGHSGLQYETSDKVIVGKPEKEGVFAADIRTALTENREYTVIPFVKTGKRIVYGPSATFISLGSQAPEIFGFTPKNARWFDTVEISGKYFSWVKNQNAITLNQVSCNVISSSDSKLRFIVNPNVNTLDNVISVSILGNKSVYNNGTLKLLPHVINNFNPTIGKWNQIITIDGRFNTFPGRTAVLFGDIYAEIISQSLNSMTVKVPYQLSDTVSVIKVVCDPFTVVSADTFHLLPPAINSIYPLSGTPGTSVTIRGRFNTSSYSVSFGSTPANVTSINDSVIKATVPAGLTGSNKINVRIFSTTVSSSDLFTIKEPLITGVFPLSGTFNDEIKISGENFVPSGISTTVTFDGIPATVKSSTESEIVVIVPLACDSIPRAMKVQIGYTSLTSADKFLLNPPEIYSISPGVVRANQDITISGNNFSPSLTGNSVWWNGIKLNIKQAKRDEIIAVQPSADFPGFTERISVSTGGYKRYSADYIEFRSKWRSIPVPSSLAWKPISFLYCNGISFVVSEKGYLIDFETGKMYSFDPVAMSFTEIGTYSNLARQQGAARVVQNDTCYLISRDAKALRFNISDNTWTQIASPGLPSTINGIAFSIKNKIYYGLTYAGGFQKNFYVYDSKTDSWSQKNLFNGTANTYTITYFSFNDKGYVMFSDRSFYQYDPEADMWIRKTNFPGTTGIFGVSTMIFNDKIIVGTGKEANSQSGPAYDILYQYDPVYNSWNQIALFPGGKVLNTSSFVINNLGYMGLGLDDHSVVHKDFYEFDPYYPSK